MMLAAHPEGHLVVTQPTHAWLAAQLARAWGNHRFGHFEPWEEVCLAAEQHDIGMTSSDRAPTLDTGTGLPTTFMRIGLESHLRMWTEGPDQLLVQSRYAALLTSLHGSALYHHRSAEPQVAAFLEQRRAFEQRLITDLDPPADEIARNQRLLWTWDGLSLGLILGWPDWTTERVPAAGQETVEMRLERDAEGHRLDPWPFERERVALQIEGRVLRSTFSTTADLRRALVQAPWTKRQYELHPA
jgi:Protein of unknown function (DUF3891)